MTTIGFIGLGHMGAPMVRNLLKAGFAVQVYDVSVTAVDAMVAGGAIAAKSVSALVGAVDVVITSVQTSEQVREICRAHSGIFAHAKPGTLYIDCSSIDVSMTLALHDYAEKIAIDMLDAPVSGGVVGAESASLTFMVGGSEKNFQRAMPIFQAMGKKIFHAGRAGCGQAAKICNNLILGVSMIAVSEAFSLAEKLGLEPSTFFAISSNSSGQCWAMTSYCPVPGIIENVPANHNYEPGFTAAMMLKDLHLGQHAAETVNAAIPLGTLASELYERFVEQGSGEKDFSGIMNFIASEEKK